jgi:hypothetical protein
MKRSKIILGLSILALGGLTLIAADHLDAPNVAGTTADITDFYAFEGADPDNTVFVVNVQSSLATPNASFDEDVMIEVNIDNDGDLVEDLVIQAIPLNGKMYFFGPYEPIETGLTSTITANMNFDGVVDITTGSNPIVATQGGMRMFAGPREDPFFFDFTQYNQVIQGPDVAPNGFNQADTANDDFAGTNVLCVAVEVSNVLLGEPTTHPAAAINPDLPDVYNVWVEAKRRQ